MHFRTEPNPGQCWRVARRTTASRQKVAPSVPTLLASQLESAKQELGVKDPKAKIVDLNSMVDPSIVTAAAARLRIEK
jgi:hypothetical protein